MPKSTSLPSPTANAPDAPCFLPKSQTWSLCSAPSGRELFPGDLSVLGLLGASRALGHFCSPVVCSEWESMLRLLLMSECVLL